LDNIGIYPYLRRLPSFNLRGSHTAAIGGLVAVNHILNLLDADYDPHKYLMAVECRDSILRGDGGTELANELVGVDMFDGGYISSHPGPLETTNGKDPYNVTWGGRDVTLYAVESPITKPYQTRRPAGI
jgi:hypothetical protein